MPIPASDKPIETLREETIDQLIMNYGHGKLSRSAFEERLDKAVTACNHQALIDVSQDLELEVDQEFIAAKRAEMGEHYPADPKDRKETIINIFGGTTRSGNWKVPKAIYVFNVFGGTDLDFADATFENESLTIYVFCLFGGVSLFVNDNFRVNSSMLSIFGGCDNESGSALQQSGPEIMIKGIVLFGGVSAEIKRTLKERLRIFAQKIKGEA